MNISQLEAALDHITNYCGTTHGSCDKCPIAVSENDVDCVSFLLSLAGLSRAGTVKPFGEKLVCECGTPLSLNVDGDFCPNCGWEHK